MQLHALSMTIMCCNFVSAVLMMLCQCVVCFLNKCDFSVLCYSFVGIMPGETDECLGRNTL